MKTQVLGICISLAVHGTAGCLLFAVGQEMSPAMRTVVLDFSLDSVGRWGSGGSGNDTGPGQMQGATAMDPSTPPIPASQPAPAPTFPQPEKAARAAPVPESLPPRPEPQPAEAVPPPMSSVPSPQSEVQEKAPPTPARRYPDLISENSEPVKQRNAMEQVREVKSQKAPPVNTDSKKQIPGTVTIQAGKRPLPPPQPVATNPEIFHATVPGDLNGSGIGGLAEPGANTEGAMPNRTGGLADSGMPARSAGQVTDTGSNEMGDGEDAYFDTQFNLIRRRLEKSLCYPQIARKRGWSGSVMVAFTIHPDGRVDDVEIKKSCGISLLDKSALKTVYNACPFPKPAMASRIIVPILYQLK